MDRGNFSGPYEYSRFAKSRNAGRVKLRAVRLPCTIRSCKSVSVSARPCGPLPARPLDAQSLHARGQRRRIHPEQSRRAAVAGDPPIACK